MQTQAQTKPTINKKKAPKIRAICAPDMDSSYVVGKPVILDSRSDISDKTFGKRIEQVGSGYETLKKKMARLNERIAQGASAHFTDDEGSGEEEIKEESKEKETPDSKKRRKTKEEIEKEAEENDLYGMLGLSHRTYEAGLKEIKHAFQKVALIHHPDKLGDDYGDAEKAYWLKVQDAYERLSDPAKRRKYDSSLPFDDSIPRKGDWTESTFYEVFAKVFTRNSRWALNKPVPNLGNDSTPLKDVKKFYSYWFDFKSWREFSQYDEYDLEEAHDRYEKRYMEKENKKLRAEHERAEFGRLMKLVRMCQESDPRIAKEAAEIEAAAQAKKKQKYDFKTQKKFEADEKIRLAQEAIEAEKKAKFESENAAKELRKQTALNYKAAVKTLTEKCTEKMPKSKFDKYWVEGILRRCSTIDRITPFIEFLETQETGDVCVQAFISFNEDYFSTEQERLARKLAREKEEAKDTLVKGAWTEEELVNLQKGLTKYAAGTNNRWLTIAEFIGTKSQKEVISKTKELADKRTKEAEEKKAKEEAAKEEALKAAAEAQAIEQEKKQQRAKQHQLLLRQQQQAKAAKLDQAAPVANVDESWSNEQQEQMEQGMKQIPSSVAVKERWISIAQLVDGKNAKECYTRFRGICARLKAEAEQKKTAEVK